MFENKVHTTNSFESMQKKKSLHVCASVSPKWEIFARYEIQPSFMFLHNKRTDMDKLAKKLFRQTAGRRFYVLMLSFLVIFATRAVESIAKPRVCQFVIRFHIVYARG
jgi:hypothetical protein